MGRESVADEDGIDDGLVLRARFVLTDWFINHIRTSDKSLASFLRDAR